MYQPRTRDRFSFEFGRSEIVSPEWSDGRGKCIQHFIQHRKFCMLNEILEAFAVLPEKKHVGWCWMKFELDQTLNPTFLHSSNTHFIVEAFASVLDTFASNLIHHFKHFKIFPIGAYISILTLVVWPGNSHQNNWVCMFIIVVERSSIFFVSGSSHACAIDRTKSMRVIPTILESSWHFEPFVFSKRNCDEVRCQTFNNSFTTSFHCRRYCPRRYSVLKAERFKRFSRG